MNNINTLVIVVSFIVFISCFAIGLILYQEIKNTKRSFKEMLSVPTFLGNLTIGLLFLSITILSILYQSTSNKGGLQIMLMNNYSWLILAGTVLLYVSLSVPLIERFKLPKKVLFRFGEAVFGVGVLCYVVDLFH